MHVKGCDACYTSAISYAARSWIAPASFAVVWRICSSPFTPVSKLVALGKLKGLVPSYAPWWSPSVACSFALTPCLPIWHLLLPLLDCCARVPLASPVILIVDTPNNRCPAT